MRATTVVVFACAIAACSFDWDRLSPAASGGAGGNATGGSAAGGAGGTSTGGSGGQGGDGGTAGDGGVGGTSDCGNGMLDAGEECDESNGTDACIECVVECRDYEVKNPATLTCYEVVGRATASWGDARNYCVDRGGDLTAFTGEAEYNFLAGILLVPGPYWIGATDVDEEGVYVWSSGEPFSYANWEDNEPTDDITVNLSEDCIDIFDDPMAGPLMGDNECINDSFWICERNPLVGQ